MEISNARTTYVDEATRSGRRPKTSGAGPTHRGAVLVAGGRANKMLVQQQRSGNNSGRYDKKGLSGGDGHDCR
jgi:hypothetical protein